jgi:hypothetical protein
MFARTEFADGTVADVQPKSGFTPLVILTMANEAVL